MKTYIDNVRNMMPIIHNITNYVTVNDVANVILACGGSPIMADAKEEVEDISSICNGLNINIGTLNYQTIPAMVLAGKKAGELGKPIVLDPVGAGASRLRTKTALDLINEIDFTVIRGNISEIKTLVMGKGNTKGVDANVSDKVTKDNLKSAVEFVKEASKKLGAIIAITGAIDLVGDSKRCYVIYNGRAEMGRITGTGCQLSGVVACFLAANREKPLEATAAAVCAMGLAGEIGWENMQKNDGNATYRNRIIDAIYNMDGYILEKGAKYELR